MNVRELKGMAVVSLADGAKVGKVEDVLIESSPFRVTALVLEGPSGQGLLPFASVRSLGEDAVTIESSAPIQWSSGQVPGSSARRVDEVLGLKVVDAAGTMGGTVHDVDFDASTGAISSFGVRSGGVFGMGAEEHTVSVSGVRGLGTSLLTVESLTGNSAAGPVS